MIEKTHGYSTKLVELGIIVLLFVGALFLRLEFQASSAVDHPIRADAAQYVLVASNLHNFGVYSSLIPPSQNTPPATDFHRPPGYPLFLYLMFSFSHDLADFVTRTTIFQALMSACGILLLYGICRQIFAPGYSFAACLPAVLSPHLIAMDIFLLTETIFTFCSLLGIYLFVLASKYRNNWLYLAAGLVFGYLVLIKPGALLFGPFVAIAAALFFFRMKTGKELVAMVLLTLIGFAAVYLPYQVIRNSGAEKFSVSGQTLWDKVVIGADINLEHFIINKVDPERQRETARMNSDKAYAIGVLKEKMLNDPVAYLKWYLGGKVIFLWKWDNIYNGDVYQYPMLRRGFEEHALLKSIHVLMKVVHWPLFVLTLLGGGAIFIRRLESKGNNSDEYLLVIPALVFLYYALLFTILGPLPRYGIPIRPFSYILAVFALKLLIEKVFCTKKNSNPVRLA